MMNYDYYLMDDDQKRGVIIFGVILCVCLAIFLLSIPVVLYNESRETVTFTVEEKEAKQDTYLLYTDEGVFCIEDSLIAMRFDSSDCYGQINEGETYTADVIGWRVPFFSWYKNVLSVE